jgi:hypothetical protein
VSRKAVRSEGHSIGSPRATSQEIGVNTELVQIVSQDTDRINNPEGYLSAVFEGDNRDSGATSRRKLQQHGITKYNFIDNNDNYMPLQNNMIKEGVVFIREFKKKKATMLPYSYTSMKNKPKITNGHKFLSLENTLRNDASTNETIRIERAKVQRGNMYLPPISDRIKLMPPRYSRNSLSDYSEFLKINKL